uniref:Uncharacterized protein n=1 Tax=Oryza brachyantha TaxID=4533 RepID=J3NE83_ORYBR
MEAVVGASHGAIGALLWKLGALLSDEYNLLTGMKSDIIFLKAELESMDAFLKKLYEVENPDEQSKFWMKEVRELYDIEDIIDISMVSLGYESNCKLSGFKGFTGRCMDFLTNVKTRHWIAKKIQYLKCCVIEASNRRARYKFDGYVSKLSRTRIDLRLPAFYTETTRLVGIDRPRDKLIKMLMGGDDALLHQLKVVSIVGFGGLGKTTLANEVPGSLKDNLRGVHDMEEIGECYFNDLINRNMILPVKIQYDGKADACRVHDMILDLIISISVKENFVTLYGDKNHKMMQQHKVRRLSLNYHVREDIMIPSNMIVSHVRSLTILGYAEHLLPLTNLQFLRVLDVENKMVLEHDYLKHIHRLSQLKYLRLNVRRITALPEQLGELQNLQTLDLRWTQIKKLLASIIRLQRLVCLRLNSLELPEGIGNMQTLQELSEIEISHNTSVYSLQELGNLNKLRILGLNWSISDSKCDMKTYAYNLVMSLCKLGMLNLRSIQIQSYHSLSLDFLLDSWFPPPRLLQKFEMSINYYFPRIPKWIFSLDYLNYLDININPVDEETFQILGDLPSLIFLWISSRVATPKERLIITHNGFQCLKEFYLTCWESGTGLMFESGAMPKLEKLRFPFNACDVCHLHGLMDFGIQHLCSLKHIHVEIVCHGAKLQEVEALGVLSKVQLTSFLMSLLLK